MPTILPVSVIIATYKRAHVISRALDSLRAQTALPQEVIVVDDASGDETPEVVRAWSEANALPVTCIVAERNGGAGAARNLAMRRAQGELLAFLDSDDAYQPTALETLAKPLLKRPDVVLSFADAMQNWADGSPGYSMMSRCVDRERDTLPFEPALPGWRELTDPQSRLLTTSVIPTCSAMFRRDAAQRVGLMPEYRHGEDWIFWLKLTGQGRFVCRFDDLADIYRQEDNQTGSQHDRRNSQLSLNALLRLRQGDFGVALTPENRRALDHAITKKAADMRYWHSRDGLGAYWTALGSWEIGLSGGRWAHLLCDPRSLARAVLSTIRGS